MLLAAWVMKLSLCVSEAGRKRLMAADGWPLQIRSAGRLAVSALTAMSLTAIERGCRS
ncbi:hypothetical protein HMPREF9946_03812 [Acetobacteraceae bacterium AT-5844]|nr:hypothetical protein HMPREF9946_03812 [Acetobacteraceae bacterium AT-5844]